MKLLVVVVNEHEHIQDVLEAMLELDMRGMTSLDSEGLIQLLAMESPIFAGLRHMFSGTKEHNKTIFGISERDTILDDLHATLKEVNVDLTAPGVGFAFTVPADGIIQSESDE